ncbi:hypothetical protein GCM10010472_21500 [Pseudonocardia halophobica]|uniref:Uncharacterized protein n=1 Tax=Pseudonocardia halophobica TaxID=29401 RepID=A0A9W6KY21_9PSEU|nr:hypothetical protein [Pseudonocardia halophobica]GLL09382.1 hypothetical protein GCM10017577_05220 [Pseudonocardia halophobica]
MSGRVRTSRRNHRRPGRPLAGQAAAGVLLAVLLAGCGVTTEDRPEPIDPSMVPPMATPTVTVVPDLGAPRPAVTEPGPSTAAPGERPAPR